MVRGALVLGCLAALYLLFAGQASGTEALAGLGATLLAGAYALALARCAPRPVRLRGVPWGRAAAASFGAVPAQSWQVARCILRGSGGAHGRQGFEAGGDDAGDAGRRAVTTLALSLAPNGYVTRVEPDRLRLHSLAARAEAADRRWPL